MLFYLNNVLIDTSISLSLFCWQNKYLWFSHSLTFIIIRVWKLYILTFVRLDILWYVDGNMKYEMTSLSQNQTVSSGEARPSFYVNPVLISLYVFVIVKLFIKHRHHLEPIHVYEFNILTDMTVWFFTFFLGNFESSFQGGSRNENRRGDRRDSHNKQQF